MEKGILPGTEHRCELMAAYLHKEISKTLFHRECEEMRDKTEPEKEQIAIKYLQLGRLIENLAIQPFL